MNRIDAVFARCRQNSEKALVGFITAGDPSHEVSLAIVKAMCDSGVDVLELGVPFSDPTADGPVIQRSSARSLKAGTRLATVIDMARATRLHSQTPIVLFSYYNPILAYGPERFYRNATAAGADGVLVVDLPPEESDELTSRWPGRDLAFIRLVAPTTPPGRMAEIAKKASGFIYLVSMTGVTGSAGLDTRAIGEVSSTLRRVCDGMPICVGFGISTPEHVRAVGPLADGVVIGSAFERLIEEHLGDPDLPAIVGRAAGRLKEATRSA